MSNNVKVIGLSATWCGKCKDAKIFLAKYDIKWLDVDNDTEATYFVDEFDVKHLPFFIIGDDDTLSVKISRSYKQVESILEKASC